MSGRIVITSTGIVSALGVGTSANQKALKDKKAGLRHPAILQTKHADEFIVGEVLHSNEELASMLNLPSVSAYTRTTLLALIAMQELMNDENQALLKDAKLALVNANTVGGMCSVEDYYLEFISDKEEGDFVQYIDTLDCAESTMHLSQHFNLKPLKATISTACSSSANAIILGARLIQAGLADKAVCGGCDALSRFTLNGFHSLKNVDKDPCRPFDKDRFGLNLGEGAGYVLLEKEEDAIARGANVLAVLSGYSNTNDAYHPTAPSPDGDGAFNTMQQALKKAKLQPEQIDYVNAHGTATLNNDAAEGKAIERLFSNANISFSSTKPYTGHTLAAAGVIEAIFSIWSLQNGVAYPNLNYNTPMEEISLQPNTEFVEKEINHCLSNSFGFGGNNVSLVFSKA